MANVIVVIPTYNEAESVGPLLESIWAIQATHCIDVLFVDDRSPDGTSDRIKQIAKANPDRNLDVLVREPGPRGLGLAYCDGFKAALARNPDAIIQMDADGQHAPSAIQSLLDGIDAGADLVIASRYVSGGDATSFSQSRRMISRLGGWGARTMLRLPVQDLTGGFKAWRPSLLQAMDFEAIQSKGFVFQIEMTLRAKRMGATIKEVPFAFGTRALGASKMSLKIAVEAGFRILRWAIRPPKVSVYDASRR